MLLKIGALCCINSARNYCRDVVPLDTTQHAARYVTSPLGHYWPYVSARGNQSNERCPLTKKHLTDPTQHSERYLMALYQLQMTWGYGSIQWCFKSTGEAVVSKIPFQYSSGRAVDVPVEFRTGNKADTRYKSHVISQSECGNLTFIERRSTASTKHYFRKWRTQHCGGRTPPHLFKSL